MVDVVERDLQLAAILRGERLVALFLPLADLGLDRGLVDALDFVVHVHVDVERLAERSEQMVLVQLRVALHRLVLDSGRDLAQLGERLALQLRKSVGHASSGVIVLDDTVERPRQLPQLPLGVPYASADDDEIAFDSVQCSNLRQLSPPQESESLEQRKARFVVAEYEPQQGVDLERRRASQRLCQQIGAEPPLSERLVNVDAQFCGPGVCRAPVKRSEERRVGKECRSRWSPYH